MKKHITELVFILDRSGSMSGLEEDTIGGFNSMIEKQKKEEGEAIITTVLFDNEYQLLHDRVDLKDIEPITDKEYYVRGTTALLDAVGLTINKLKKDAAEKVMFVITTDGYENASVEFTYDKVRQMIEYQKEKQSWEFIFLGANIDAVSTAQELGINENRAANFNADSQGLALNYEVISEAVSEIRANKDISENWKERIEDDYKKRD